jgi:hypothetical protein
LVSVPAGIGAERPEYAEAGNIEIPQHEDLFDVVTEAVKQHSGRCDRHSLIAHQCDVESFLELGGFEDWMKSLLLDVEHIAEAVLWADCWKCQRDLGRIE